MRIAMVIGPGAEAELLDAQLAFHLNAGVDLVLAPAPDTTDAAREVFETYERAGYVARTAATSIVDVERSASLAATEYDADWLIVSGPTEFWLPRASTIGDVLVAVPPRYGIVQALVREFVPRRGDESFAERMTVRDSLAEASAGDRPLLDRLRPIRRLQKGRGLHGGQALRAWYPLEVLRYPAPEAVQSSSDEAVAEALDAGSLVVDERLRDALRALKEGSSYRLPTGNGISLGLEAPTVVDDALYAVECAAVGEVNLDRLDRQIRDLEARLAVLESRFWPRLQQFASRLVGGRRRHRG